MKLQIEQAHIEAMMAAFPGSTRCANSSASGIGWRSFHTLEAPELDLLETLYRAGDAEDRAKAAQIATLRHALAAGPRFERRAGDGRAGHRPLPGRRRQPRLAVLGRHQRQAAPGWSRGWISPASKERRQDLRRAQGQLPRLAATTLRITGPTSPGAPWPRSWPPRATSRKPRRSSPATTRWPPATSTGAGATARSSPARHRLVCREPHRHHRDTDWSRKDQVILSSTGRPRGW
jgi:hypothetical protein